MRNPYAQLVKYLVRCSFVDDSLLAKGERERERERVFCSVRCFFWHAAASTPEYHRGARHRQAGRTRMGTPSKSEVDNTVRRTLTKGGGGVCMASRRPGSDVLQLFRTWPNEANEANEAKHASPASSRSPPDSSGLRLYAQPQPAQRLPQGGANAARLFMSFGHRTRRWKSAVYSVPRKVP
ncbi:hypothetical protein VTG60DRAFT_420 [Thermothelomyces hinnuleus]